MYKWQNLPQNLDLKVGEQLIRGRSLSVYRSLLAWRSIAYY